MLKNLPGYILITTLFMVLGCSDTEQFQTAPVSGSVTSGDKPVTEGQIIFSPIGSGKSTMVGKSATGAIKDGKFILSTYGNGDGAVVGKHAVMVLGKETPPEDPADIEWGNAPNWGSTKETFEVVMDKDNNFDITLTPPKKKRGKDEDEDDDD